MKTFYINSQEVYNVEYKVVAESIEEAKQLFLDDDDAVEKIGATQESRIDGGLLIWGGDK
jgi:hypothetical protein